MTTSIGVMAPFGGASIEKSITSKQLRGWSGDEGQCLVKTWSCELRESCVRKVF